MTTVASTIIPILIANPPNEVRFAERPEYHIRMKATSMQNGMPAAVINEPRKSPSRSKRIMNTRISPSISDSVTVWTLWSIRSD